MALVDIKVEVVPKACHLVKVAWAREVISLQLVEDK